MLFGVNHNQKEPLLKFQRKEMQECFDCALKMLSNPQARINGVSLLSEVTSPLRPEKLRSPTPRLAVA